MRRKILVNYRIILTISLALLLYLSSDCSGQTHRQQPAKGKILAVVDDETITELELLEYALTLPLEQAIQELRDKEAKEKLLQRLINDKLLLAEARKRNLETDETVKQKLEQMKNDLLIMALIESEIQQVEVSDKEIETYYQQHPDEFKAGKRVRARHIVLKDEDQAQQILKRLRLGENFATLAQQESIGSDKQRGGDLGFVSPGDFLPTIGYEPAIEQAIFSLKENEISQLIKTHTRVHIVKVEEIEEQSKIELAEAREEIEKKLSNLKMTERLENLMKNLRNKASVKIFPENLVEGIDQKIPGTDELLKGETKPHKHHSP